MEAPTAPPVFREVIGERLKLNFHWAQAEVWRSQKRFVFFLAGTQSGKTCLVPHWLYREMVERGAGDYIVATATYPLLKLKLLPEILGVFENLLKLGTYRESDKYFLISEEGEIALWGARQEVPTRIIFGSATTPESLESTTAKAAVLDECGQNTFRRDSWEAILRRLSIAKGRVLGTTTLYSQGWLKSEVYDPWKAGEFPDCDIIQADSTCNPTFPMEEYERARESLPSWKFDLFYRGRFSKPAGMIYDNFREEVCKVKRFEIPKEWPCYVGHDFGSVNTAAVWYAQEPQSGIFYAYREYRAGGRSMGEHVLEWLRLSQGENIVRRTGGNHQEQGWRDAAIAAGWPIAEPRVFKTHPTRAVEIGIDRVYELHSLNKIVVFEDLAGYLDEKLSYSRELDDSYQPTEKIANKANYHLMDSERSILSEFTTEIGKRKRRRRSFSV